MEIDVTRFEEDKTPVIMYDMAFANTSEPFALVKIIVELDVLLNCVLKLRVAGRTVFSSLGVKMIPFWGKEYVGASEGVRPTSWIVKKEFDMMLMFVNGPRVDETVR